MSPLGLLFALFCVSVFSMKRDLTELLFALFCVSVISLKNEKGGVLFALFCVSVILCNGTMKRGAICAILRFCVNWKHEPFMVAVRAILRFCIFNEMIPYWGGVRANLRLCNLIEKKGTIHVILRFCVSLEA